MKTVYPESPGHEPLIKALQSLQSRLARRNAGQSRLTRLLRCRSKLFSMHLLVRLERWLA